jgi:hypothetical protein
MFCLILFKEFLIVHNITRVNHLRNVSEEPQLPLFWIEKLFPKMKEMYSSKTLATINRAVRYHIPECPNNETNHVLYWMLLVGSFIIKY